MYFLRRIFTFSQPTYVSQSGNQSRTAPVTADNKKLP